MADSDVLLRRSHRWIVVSIAFAAFMSKLDTYVVNIALPSIARCFNVETGEASLTVIFYFLAGTSTLLFFGKLGDRVGVKKVFVAGYSLFTLGSLLCSLSWDIYALTGFRFLQGLGGAMLLSSGYAGIPCFLPPQIRGWGFGLLTTGAAAGVVVGAPLGGLLTGYLSWHWVFLVNVPVGIGAIFLAHRILPEPMNPPIPSPSGSGTGFDIMGTVLSLLGLSALLYGLTMGDEWGWSSVSILSLLGSGLSLLGAFLLWERVSGSPLLDYGLFKNRTFVTGNLAAFFAWMLLGGNTFLMPFYLEMGKGLVPEQTGLVIALFSIVYIAVGPYAGRLSDRVNPGLLTSLAMAFGALCTLLFSLGLIRPGILPAVVYLLSLGLSYGFFISPNNNMIMKTLQEHQEGAASGLFTTITTLGTVLGVSILETVFSVGIPHRGRSVPGLLTMDGLPSHALFSGFRDAYMLGGLLALIAFLISLSMRRRAGEDG